MNNSISKDGSLSRKPGPPGSRRTESLFHLLALTGLISACGGGSSNPPAPQTYTIGGGVTGLSAGESLVLQESGGGNTTVTANGNFTLPTALTSGTTFTVTVLTLPSGEGCSVANGSGTVAASAVNTIAVSCGVPNLALLAGNTGGAGNADATGPVARFDLQLAGPTDLPWLYRYGAAYGQGAVALDVGGSVWIADSGNETIRKISPSGVVTTVAGKAGVTGSINGAGPDARFRNPTGIAVDLNGNAYIADTGNNVIRKISPAGTVSTFAGTVGVVGASDGLGAAASFQLAVESPVTNFTAFPRGRGALAVDGNGNVFVADSGNSTIRQITPAGMVSTLAGKAGVVGTSDGVGAAASFSNPVGIATDKAGNVYVADSMLNPGIPFYSGQTIRQVTPTGTVTTIAGTVGTQGSSDGVGTAASFVLPTGVATDGLGNIYVADNLGNTIRKIAPGGVVSTFAGSPRSAGSADGTGADARFNLPSSLASDGAGNIYVVDAANNTVRTITPAGVVTTFAGAPAVAGSADGAGAGATFNSPFGVTTDSAGNLYVADSGSNLIRKVTPSGTVTTFAGTAGQSGGADGTGATFNHPTGVTVDATGNIYVADSYNEEIRKITPAGVVSTLAGNLSEVDPAPGVKGGSADGTGANASFRLSIIVASPSILYYPTCHGGVAADTDGNVYVADCGNDTIRKVTASGVVTTFAGVAGVADGADGTGSGAHFSQPTGVATDSVGNIYVADAGNNTIRKVTLAGVVTTVAGTAGVAGSADGTGSAASFNDPEGVTVDNSGNLYVADTGNNTIRKITPAGVVTTVLGVPGVSSFLPGGLPGLLSSPVGVAISGGTLFVTTGNGIAVTTYIP